MRFEVAKNFIDRITIGKIYGYKPIRFLRITEGQKFKSVGGSFECVSNGGSEYSRGTYKYLAMACAYCRFLARNDNSGVGRHSALG